MLILQEGARIYEVRNLLSHPKSVRKPPVGILVHTGTIEIEESLSLPFLDRRNSHSIQDFAVAKMDKVSQKEMYFDMNKDLDF